MIADRRSHRRSQTAICGTRRGHLDENDGRYWERTYPHGDWHGGGPPCLTNITFDAAKEKYKVGN
jgi:hypothetical protein